MRLVILTDLPRSDFLIGGVVWDRMYCSPSASYTVALLKLLASSFRGSRCRIKSTEDPGWISMIFIGMRVFFVSLIEKSTL
jgi:hypothetical protein